MRARLRPLLSTLLFGLYPVFIAACSGTGVAQPAVTPSGSGSASTAPLLVLAASDLQFALPEIVSAYEKARGRKVTITIGSTGNFAAQIENGAPADLFFAADRSFLDRLDQKGLVLPETRQLYAIGRIVVTPAQQTTVEVTTLEDLLQPELKKIAIANPEHAPYGRAAQQALTAAGLWSQLEPKIVYAENIAQAFQFVQTGNADAGIVALSVVLGVAGTPYTLIESTLHEPLAQEAAVLTSSQQPDAAKDFLAFVQGPDGRPVMKRYGFVLPGEQ